MGKPLSYVALKWLRKNWHWGNIITFATLLYTVYYSAKNDADNNKELKRISDRDSAQAYRDNIQTQTLTEEYKNQIAETKRNRAKDSTQLALFSSQIRLLNQSLKSQNEGLQLQNKSLEVQRLASKSQLIVKVNIEGNAIKNGYASPVLLFQITNLGNSTAQNIVSKYCIVSVNNAKGGSISCTNPPDIAYREKQGFLIKIV